MAETHTISSEEAKARQYRQEAEYLRLCELHNVEPAPPSYRGSGYCFAGTAVDDAILSHRQSSLDGGVSTDFDYDLIDRNLEKAESGEDIDCDVSIELHPDAERVLDWVLDLAISDSTRISAQAIGIKVIALAWLLEKGVIGARSQTEVADRIKTTRSNFSQAVRQIQKEIGGNFRARGQKSEEANEKYRAIRNAAVLAGHGNLKRKHKMID
jgi:hypothetical protein